MSYTLEYVKTRYEEIKSKTDLIDSIVLQYEKMDFVDETSAKTFRKKISGAVAELSNYIKESCALQIRSDENVSFKKKQKWIEYRQNNSEKMSDAMVETNPEVIAAKEKYIEAYSTWKFLVAKIDSYFKVIDALSSELKGNQAHDRAIISEK